MIADKRTIERFVLALPIHLKSAGVVHPDTLTGDIASNVTRDISSNGAFVETANLLSLGEKVELIAILPSGKVFLNATGKVVRVEQDGMAIKFKRPSIFLSSNITH